MPDLGFNIKLKMADFGKAVTDSIKKMKPVQIPTQAGGEGGTAAGSKGGISNLKSEMQARFADAGNGIKEMISRFGAELDSSDTMSDALGAFKNLGDGVTKVLFKTLAPWGKWILLVGGIVAKFSKYAAEMEQTQMKFDRAFSRGGRSQGAGTARFQQAIQDVSSDGLYTAQSATEALGNIRASNPYLSSEELEKSLKLGKELASLTGGDLVGSTEKVASVLHSESVDMQSLIDLGVVLDATEMKRLQSLDTWATRAQRNQMIMEKIAEANKGGAEEFGSTLNGQWQKFTAMLESIKLSIGKIVSPIMRVVMDIVNPIMEIGKELFSYFEDSVGSGIDLIANGLSTVIKPIGAILVGITKTLVNISKILFGPIIQVIKFISSFWKSSGNETTKRIKQYYDFINKILVGIQRLQQALMNGWFKMFKSGYNSYVKPFVDAIVDGFNYVADYIMGIFDKLKETLEGWFDWADKLTGGMLSEYFKEGDEEAQKKKEENYVDPRAKLNVNFEDATSMTNRIQKSILERQSPQVKMVDLLTKINEKVDEIGSGQKKTADINEQQVSETRVTNTTLRKQNVGLQYG